MFEIQGGAWVGFFVGGLFIAVGLFLAIRTIFVNIKCTESVTARVSEIREEWSQSSDESGGSWVYFPVFQFTAQNGRIVEAKASVGRGRCPYQVGQAVELPYDPEKPERIAVRKDVVTAIVIGFAFAAIGAGILILMKIRGYW